MRGLYAIALLFVLALAGATASVAPRFQGVETTRMLTVSAPSEPGRPPHVSAASGLVKTGDTLWVASDDENFVAKLDAREGRWVRVLAGTLPAEKEERRAAKPDFEAVTAIPGGLLVLASGSAPNRTKAVFVPLDEGTPRVLELGPVYAALGAQLKPLNIEGAAVSGDTLRLFNRGANAVIELELAAVLKAISAGEPLGGALVKRVVKVELGSLGGVPLGFTDASPLPDGSVVFTASAEDTPDPTKDGAVSGSLIGVLSPDGAVLARFEVKGVKLEGVHAELKDGAVHVLLVSDADDSSVPSPLMSAVLPSR